MKKRFLVVTAIIVSSQLLAQQDSSSHSLDEVIITASKYPRKQSETGKVITVIGKDQLEKNSGKTLGEVLNTVSGTTIIGANNAPGTNQTVSIRGASAGNVLVLIDGIPVNDPSVITNYFDLNLLPLDQVERIEILKGGQSTLYGSDAVAGVINIISKKTATKKVSIHAGLTGGSYNTLNQNIGISGKLNKTNYAVGYTHMSSDGFSTAFDKNKTGNFDKDGFNQHAVNGRLGFALGKRITLSLFSTYSYYQTDLDAAAFTDEKDYAVKNNNVQGGTGLSYSHQKGSLHANYHFNYVARDYLDDSVFKSNPFVDYSNSSYIGRTHYAEVYNNWKWNKWELLTGIDYRSNNTYQHYFSTGSFGPYAPPALQGKMNQFSFYASVIFKNKKGFTTEAGGRWNDHSTYGSNFTFTLNPSLLFQNKVKLFANLYSSFKAPTLYQLFDESAGNLALQPEKGWIAEVGVELVKQKGFYARITGFNRNTDNAIVYTYNPSTFEAQYRNVSEQKNYGAELEASFTIGKFSVQANYTYTDGELTSAFDGTGAPLGKDTTYYNLYRIPKHAINAEAGVQVTKQFFASLRARSVSERSEYVYGGAPEKLKGYTTFDLYAEYKFSGIFKTFVDARNITNQEYFDILGYNSRKFNLTAGLSFHL